jgi:hypothetical protein
MARIEADKDEARRQYNINDTRESQNQARFEQ